MLYNKVPAIRYEYIFLCIAILLVNDYVNL